MPNIAEYTNPDDSLRPNDAGVQAAAQAGRRIGSFYHQIGQDIGGAVKEVGDQYEDHQAQQEISHGFASGMTVANQLQQQADTFAKGADPNDPTWTQKFLEGTAQPAIQAWQDSFQTPKGKLYAAQHAADITEQLTHKVMADRSTLAGQAAVNNFEQGTNQAAQMAYTDPANLDKILGTHDMGTQAVIDGMPNLTADQAGTLKNTLGPKAKQQIAVSGIMGWMDKGQAGIDQARKLLIGGTYADELGDKVPELMKQADIAERSLNEQNKAATAQFKQQQEESGKQAIVDLRTSVLDPATGIPKWTPQAIKQLTNIGLVYGKYIPGEIIAAQGAVEENVRRQIDHADVQSDPTTWSHLMSAAGKPQTAGGLTSQTVDTAYAQGKLSDHDYAKAHEMIERQGAGRDPQEQELTKTVNEFYASAKPMIGPTMMGEFTRGDAAARFYTLQQDTQNAVDSMRASGKSPSEIRAALFDPRAPTYMGNRIGAYAITTQQGMNLATSKLQGDGSKSLPPPSLSATAYAGIKAAPPAPAPAAGGTSKMTPDQQAWLKAHP